MLFGLTNWLTRIELTIYLKSGTAMAYSSGDRVNQGNWNKLIPCRYHAYKILLIIKSKYINIEATILFNDNIIYNFPLKYIY